MWWPRGWGCWWWYINPYVMYPSYWRVPQPAQPVPGVPYPPPPFLPPPPTPEDEIEALEAYKAELEEELRSVEARIRELRDFIAKRGKEGK